LVFNHFENHPYPSKMTETEDLIIRQQRDLLKRLIWLRNQVECEGAERFKKWASWIEREEFVESGKNLANYLALRKHDLRVLQKELSPLGLSSLGRLESKVLPALDAVIASLAKISQSPKSKKYQHPAKEIIQLGNKLLKKRCNHIFGKSTSQTRIMVTLSGETAVQPEFIENLVARGMNVARINCAHDDREIWKLMIQHVREASRRAGSVCRIMMDLAGPKARITKISFPVNQKRIFSGDTIRITEIPDSGSESEITIQINISQIFKKLGKGQEVWIDDGKIGATVEVVTGHSCTLEVFHAGPKGTKLTCEKGINFPGIDIGNALSDSDIENIDFITEYADLIGYSFIQKAEDLDILDFELSKRSAQAIRLPVVAKIETELAVQNLPEIIVKAAGRRPLAIMIARGDLAVEIGYERLAEIQEEIMWLAEAAHIPVIWATQVLERLVKKGVRSRAEITDAAMSVRAECVMLNKGAYVLEAIEILRDLYKRMHQHQEKKSPQLRALKSWTAV
jgi:pyruvate kinase